MEQSKLKSFLVFTFILFLSIYFLVESGGQLLKLQNHFQNCEYQKAIDLADKILNEKNLDKSDQTEILIIKGISEFSSNQFTEAENTFNQLLSIDKNLSLESRSVSPKIVDFFNNLKKTSKVNSINKT